MKNGQDQTDEEKPDVKGQKAKPKAKKKAPDWSHFNRGHANLDAIKIATKICKSPKSRENILKFANENYFANYSKSAVKEIFDEALQRKIIVQDGDKKQFNVSVFAL